MILYIQTALPGVGTIQQSYQDGHNIDAVIEKLVDDGGIWYTHSKINPGQSAKLGSQRTWIPYHSIKAISYEVS